MTIENRSTRLKIIEKNFWKSLIAEQTAVWLKLRKVDFDIALAIFLQKQKAIKLSNKWNMFNNNHKKTRKTAQYEIKMIETQLNIWDQNNTAKYMSNQMVSKQDLIFDENKIHLLL